MLLNILNPDLNGMLSEVNFNNVARAYLGACLADPSVYAHALRVARYICNGAALYKS